MSGYPIDKDSDVPLTPEEKKKYVRIWRIEASKEFIIFMSVIVFAIATSIYNPIEIRKIGEQLVIIATQNLNNTDRIIDYLDISNRNETAKGIDIIKVLFLYDQDAQRDNAKIMEALNITNTHFVHVNGTHVITENGSSKLPYPIDMTGFVPEPNQNITIELESIKD